MRFIITLLSILGVSAIAAQPVLAKAMPAPPVAPAAVLSLPVPSPTPPPARVGRVSIADGGLSFRAAGRSSWSPALVNYPAASGEAFRTAPDGKAEIEIGSDEIALAGDAELDIARLNRRSIALALVRGRIGFRLNRLAAGESVTVRLPQGSARLLAPGAYDIAAGDATAPARLAVFAGSAHFTGGGADLAVRLGETALLSGIGRVTATTAPAANDAFAQWWRSRGHRPASALPAGLSPEMTGLADLAQAGHWTVAPGIGEIWYPRGVPANWVPYRYGHWAWLKPWGWTWIDDQPWGFAPFHYGRWALIGAHWGWAPGRRARHPVYAPALVAFLGTAGVGLSFAGGNGPAIGWFPLAPGEIYWPSYTDDLAYVRRLNRPDVANARTIRMGGNGKPPIEVVNWRFAYRLYATVAPRPVFADGRPVSLSMIELPRERLLNAPAIMGSPEITPQMLRALAAAPPRRIAEKPVLRRVAAERFVRKPAQKPIVRRVLAERYVRKPAQKPIVRRALFEKRIVRRAAPAKPVLRRPVVRLSKVVERSRSVRRVIDRGHPPGRHLRAPAVARAAPTKRRILVRAHRLRFPRKPAAHPRPRRVAKALAKFRVAHRAPSRKRRL